MNEELKVLLVGDDTEMLESIKSDLLEFPNHKRVSFSDANKELERSETDVVIILASEDFPIEGIQSIARNFPDTAVLYLHNRQDFQLVRDVIRAGADDYLVIPDELNLLPDRLHSISATFKKRKNDQTDSSTGFKRGRGKVISFHSGNGGTGKTFLSTAFAQTLKLESTAQVIFIDLNLQYGGAETFLGIDTNRSLIDLSPVIQELNENHIRNVTEKEAHSKLELLISPRDAEAAETINGNYITKVIRACKRSFDFVIIDLPTYMDENTFAALEESDRIYYVMKVDTPSIRILRSVEELYKRLNLSLEGKLELVLNETGRENELSNKDLSGFIQWPIAAKIRRDIKGVQAAVNQGTAIRKEPNEKKLIPAAKDIQKWVSTLLK